MSDQKAFQELTIRDTFLFTAVMLQGDNCRSFLELTLGFPIARVKVIRENTFFYHPEYPGLRLDVFAGDEKQTYFCVEIQIAAQDLGKRARYFHNRTAQDLFLAGYPSSQLPETYAILLCDFNSLEERGNWREYFYHAEMRCTEIPELRLQDGTHTILLNPLGENPQEVSPELVKFLHYVKADLAESQKDFEDAFVRRLQDTVAQIKASREMEERYLQLTAASALSK